MSKKLSSRLLVVALALTLISACFVGSTFAKYVHSASGSDNARVAKFGVTITPTDVANLFLTEYDKNDNAYSLTAKSVISSGTDDLVAPGTSGNFAGFTIAGTPEVAVRVTHSDANLDLGDKWVDEDGNYYCPLTITVGTTVINGLEQTSAAAFESAVEAAINAYTHDYAPNSDLSAAATTDTLAISWAWAFEGATGQDNVKDTYLGDQAAAGNAATISLEYTCTVTQID